MTAPSDPRRLQPALVRALEKKAVRNLGYLGLFALQNGRTPGDFRVLHPDSTLQDTYDETVAEQGFDPLHACPEHRQLCAGAECCCSESHRVAS